MARNFKDLSEREILALAIALEEEDGRIYGDFEEGLRETYPASAKLFTEMQAEESGHRAALLELYRAKFGEHIPHIRRQDVKGFVDRRPVWLIRPLGLHVVRRQRCNRQQNCGNQLHFPGPSNSFVIRLAI